MAKSIRSKRKRKMRNVKRVRYGRRELEALKNCVKAADISHKNGENQLYSVVTKDELQKRKESEEFKKKLEADAAKMETEHSQKFDKKTRMNEDGQYPVWMNQRTIHKLRSRRGKPLKGKKKGKQTLAW